MLLLAEIIFVIWQQIGRITYLSDKLNSNSQSQTETPTMSVEEIKRNTLTISYDELMRNNELYTGKIVYYRGRVLQVSEVYVNGDEYILRVATKHDRYLDSYYDDVIWVNYRGHRLLEDDIIIVWGRVEGRKTYESVMGGYITIPEVTALYLELARKAGY